MDADRLLAEAKQLLDEADSLDARSDAAKKKAAENVWLAHQQGMSTREIGKRIGRHHDTVADMIKTHKHLSAYADKSYTDAYYEVRPDATPEATKMRHAKDILARGTTEQVREIVDALPDGTKAQLSVISSAAMSDAPREPHVHGDAAADLPTLIYRFIERDLRPQIAQLDDGLPIAFVVDDIVQAVKRLHEELYVLSSKLKFDAGVAEVVRG